MPWADRALFAELMLGWELRSYREARSVPEAVILDRGLPDVLGYLTLCGLPVPDHVRKAVELYRYNRTVFIAPRWPDIFSQDAERKQSPDEAQATYRVMAETYARLGYDVVPLPLASIEERAAMVRSVISNRMGAS